MTLAQEILQDALSDESPRDYLYGYFSDMYKDANGVRPRWVGRDGYSLSVFSLEIAKLHDEVAETIRRECDWVAKEEKRVAQEEAEHHARVDEILNPPQGDWGTIGSLNIL